MKRKIVLFTGKPYHKFILREFQWETALSSEKADSLITYLSEVMAIEGIPIHINTDDAIAYAIAK